MLQEEIYISDELVALFEEEAKQSILEVLKGDSIPNELYDTFKKGYVTALVNNYKRNNGMPTIPYPLSLTTTDIITARSYEGRLQILLGKKPGQDKWQFPGGFRDPKETSVEAAARELFEEATLKVETSRLEFVKEMFVDDIRYRNTPHKITTSIFFIKLYEEEYEKAVAGDDLEFVKWFDYQELKLVKKDDIIREIHIPIFNLIVDNYNRIVVNYHSF